MTAGPGKASLITGIGAFTILAVLVLLTGIGSVLGLGRWIYSAAGFLGMLCWGAHIVGIGFAIEALRSKRADRRTGLIGLAINAGSLAVWLLCIPLALS